MKKLTLFALVLCALPLPAVAQEPASPLAMTVVNVTADAEAAAGTPRASVGRHAAGVPRPPRRSAAPAP